MDLKAVGQRIKAAREAKNLTQEELAALVNLSTTHVSVIERCIRPLSAAIRAAFSGQTGPY